MNRPVVALGLVVCVFASSCSKPPLEATPPSAPQPAPSAAQKAEAPEIGALAVFVEGPVTIFQAGQARPLEIGDRVGIGDTVRSGPLGACELRFGNAATIVVRPDTILSIDEAVVADSTMRVDAYLESGEILNKVRLLGGHDSFTIRTASSICGVRGTEFIVSSNGPDSMIAVRTGQVAALAANPVLSLIADAAGDSALARASLRLILDSAYTVSADEELRLGKAESAASEVALRGIAAYIGLPADAIAAPTSQSGAFRFGPEESVPLLVAEDAETLDNVGALARSGIKSPRTRAVPASAASRELFKAFDSVGGAGSDARTLSDTPLSLALGLPRLPGGASQAIRASETSSQAKAEAVIAAWKAAGGPIAGSVLRVVGSDIFVVTDRAGSLYGMSSDGAALWRVDSANGDSSQSQASQFKGLIYFAGSKELVSVDASSGVVVGRVAMDATKALPGSRIVQFPGAVAVPTIDGFDLRDERSGILKLSVSVPGGTSMSPGNHGGLAAVVNRKGLFMLIDPSTGDVKASVQTGATSPSSQAPRLFGSRACFGDKNGLVVMIDLSAMRVLWEKSLPEPAGVTSDVEMGESGVFVFAKGTIYGFSLDGEQLLKPIRGVSAPPLLSKSVLYYGSSDGFLVAMKLSPPPGEIGRAPLGSTASARPLFADGFVYVGTKTGRLVKVDPGKL